MAESRELQVLLTLKDNVSSNLERVSANARKVGVAFAAIGGSITAGVAVSIKAFQAQEKAEARLEQIATQVTGATQEQIQGFKDLAAQLQAVGVVGDEVLISGQSQLASFTKSSAVVSELSDDLADLAVATYGTNVSQEQAIQTANMLGKALSGQLGALTRSGVLVSDELTAAFEAANSEQERSVILSKIIQDNYGGLNAKLRETSEGGLQVLKNDFGDLTELVGGAVIPAITNLVSQITPVVASISEWAQANPELFSKITMVVAAVGALMLALSPILIMLPGIIALFGLLTGPVGLVVLAVAALVAGGIALWQNWDTVSAKAIELKDGIVNAFNIIKDGVISVVNFLVSTLTFLFGLYIGIWIGIFEMMGIDIFAVWESVYQFISEKWTQISTAVGEKLTEIHSRIMEFVTPVKEAFSALWDSVKNSAVGAFETVKNSIKSAINWIIEKINAFIRSANEIASKANVIPGVNIPQIPEIPMLAKGGIVTKPTLAVVGEAGPEAVVPLNKSNGFGGGAPTIIINWTGAVDRTSAEMVAGEIMRTLSLNQRIPT